MLLFVASFLCLLINIFSIGYMNTDEVNDNKNHRFYAEFVLFCSGMLGMVLSDSFLWLFIFWELMGLCSYLLIGFYYDKPSAAYAAKKAFLTTRVGDVFLVIGLAMLWNLFQPYASGGDALAFATVFDHSNLQMLADAGKQGALQLALGFMFIGAVGKSAQFPLHVWLPDAMEGPTPVSALIHAATMVNAGLYLVARMFPIFGDSDDGRVQRSSIHYCFSWWNYCLYGCFDCICTNGFEEGSCLFNNESISLHIHWFRCSTLASKIALIGRIPE